MTVLQISDLIAHLGRGARHGYYWHRAGKRTQWYDTTADVIPHPAQLQDVYFGVHPCGAIPPGDPAHVRGQVDYIGAVNAFFVDIDFKALGEEQARARVDGLRDASAGPGANVIINSGAGFHVYWLLDQPIVFEHIGQADALRAHVARLQAQWVGLIGGDPGAKDLARVLRVPNSLNCKPEYGTPRRVQIVFADLSSLYRPADIEALVGYNPDVGARPLPENTRCAPTLDCTLAPANAVGTQSAVPRKGTKSSRRRSRGSVIEMYNQRIHIRALLAAYGYTIRGDKFTRPGKAVEQGISGTIRDDTNTCYTFSSNDPAYQPTDTSPSGAGCTLRPFDLLARLSFHGDARAAVKHLYEETRSDVRHLQDV